MEHIVESGACLIVNLSAGVASESARFFLSVVGPSHPVVVPPGGLSRQARVFLIISYQPPSHSIARRATF